MLVIFVLKREKLLVLVRLPARRAKFSRQKIEPPKQLFVVKRCVDETTGKDHQSAPAAQIALEGLERHLRKVRHVGQDDRVKFVEPGLGQLRRGQGRRFDEIAGGGFQRYRGQGLFQKVGFAVARFTAGFAIDQQHSHFLDGANDEAAPVVGG